MIYFQFIFLVKDRRETSVDAVHILSLGKLLSFKYPQHSNHILLLLLQHHVGAVKTQEVSIKHKEINDTLLAEQACQNRQ